MLLKETKIYTASDYEIVKEINQGRDLLPVSFKGSLCYQYGRWILEGQIGGEEAGIVVFVKASEKIPGQRDWKGEERRRKEWEIQYVGLESADMVYWYAEVRYVQYDSNGQTDFGCLRHFQDELVLLTTESW